MIEKEVLLEDVSPPDLLGVHDVHLRRIAKAYPKSKLVLRGDRVHLQGPRIEVKAISTLLEALKAEYYRYGEVTEAHVVQHLSALSSDATALNASMGTLLLRSGAGEKIYPRTSGQKRLVAAVEAHDVVFATGVSGTGKTFLSVAMAVRALRLKQVKRIIITRPAVEAGENLGFLPGDLREKIEPYLQPVHEALRRMIPKEKLDFFMSQGLIEMAPLAYMRGRTLDEAFILLDEAQNTTSRQLKMFLTRMGVHSRMVITGDPSQVDLPGDTLSGLEEAIRRLKGVSGIAFVRLGASDVLRHPIVRRILDAYNLKK